MKYFFLLFCLILCSCELSAPDCCDDRQSMIEFSKGELSFNMQEGIDSVSVFVIDDVYWWFEDSQRLKSIGCNFFKPAEDLNYCSNNYCNEDKNHIMKIECPWFSTLKKDSSTILVSVKQNDTEEKRSQDITIKGNYPREDYGDGVYDYENFTITQCPEPVELSKETLLFNAKGGVDSVIIAMNRDFRLSPKIQYGGYIAAYINYYDSPIRIESPWFTISTSEEEKKIFFSVNKNDTKEERSFIIILENRCEKIYVYQSAD